MLIAWGLSFSGGDSSEACEACKRQKDRRDFRRPPYMYICSWLYKVKLAVFFSLVERSRTLIAERFEESPRERVRHQEIARAILTAELERSERHRHAVAARLPVSNSWGIVGTERYLICKCVRHKGTVYNSSL